MKIQSVNHLFRETADVLENLNELAWAVGDEHESLGEDPDYWFSIVTEDFFAGPIYDQQRHRNLRLCFGRLARRERSQMCEGTVVTPAHAVSILRLSGALNISNRRLFWSLGIDDMIRLALMAQSQLVGD